MRADHQIELLVYLLLMVSTGGGAASPGCDSADVARLDGEGV